MFHCADTYRDCPRGMVLYYCTSCHKEQPRLLGTGITRCQYCKDGFVYGGAPSGSAQGPQEATNAIGDRIYRREKFKSAVEVINEKKTSDIAADDPIRDPAESTEPKAAESDSIEPKTPEVNSSAHNSEEETATFNIDDIDEVIKSTREEIDENVIIVDKLNTLKANLTTLKDRKMRIAELVAEINDLMNN